MSKAGRAPHVALVAWAYPPSSATGGLRALALSRWLVQRGCRVTVICADPIAYEAFFQTDSSLREHVPAEVNVVTTDFTPESMNPLLNSWPERRIRNNKRWTRKWQEAQQATFPENTYPVWISSALASLFQIQTVDPISLVIATAAPYSAFAAAVQFHDSVGVPFILDDRDSFLLDVLTGEPLPESEQRLPLFREYVSKAEGYWCVNNAIATSLRQEAEDGAAKVTVVPNGWDSYANPATDSSQESGVGKEPATEKLRGDRAEGPTFLFVGTITRTFPAERVAEAWSDFRSHLPSARLLMAGGIGYGRSANIGSAKILGETPGIKLLGRVGRSDLVQAYEQADVLLFAKEGGALVTSSKIYEYISTGLPIVALGAANIGARQEIADYPRVFWGDLAESSSGSRAFSAAAADAASGRSPEHARAAARRFERSATFERTAGPPIDEILAT